jgi:hypothetical protein
MRRAAPLLFLLAASCGPTPRTDPDGPDESAVRKYVLDHADDPASVDFAEWGPNIPAETYRRAKEGGGDAGGLALPPLADEGKPLRAFVRVVYGAEGRHGARERRGGVLRGVRGRGGASRATGGRPDRGVEEAEPGPKEGGRQGRQAREGPWDAPGTPRDATGEEGGRAG